MCRSEGLTGKREDTAMKTVCVLGLGYIGLPTSLMFATAGHLVRGVDINPDVISLLGKGSVHFEEPGLGLLLREVLATRTLSLHPAPVTSDVFIICVPTPLGNEKRANLDHVRAASRSIIPFLQPGNLIILESTVPPRTCIDVLKPILEESGLEIGKDLFLAFCPERVIPNKILVEIVENDRICGGFDEKSLEMATGLYRSFVRGEIHGTDCTTAEMVKLMENTFRDVNIALANEFALICEKLKINAWEAIRLANKHPRVSIHAPGPGVGGHCIPVVPWFIVEKDMEGTPLIQRARAINDDMPAHVARVVGNFLDLSMKPVVTVLGVAFKPNTDDASMSPATRLIELLGQSGAVVKAHDPIVKSFHVPLLSIEEALVGSECIVLVTDHDEFKEMDVAAVARAVKKKLVIDTRNALDHERLRASGFVVHVLGVPGKDGMPF